MKTPCIGNYSQREEIIYTNMNKKQIKYLADGVVHSLEIPATWSNINEEFVLSYFHEYFKKFHGSAEIEILKDNTINEGARLLKG